LRDEAATVIACVCKRYGSSYSTLQPRISKTLHEAFINPKRPLTTSYGAIVGITKLGPLVVELLLLPELQTFIGRLQQLLETGQNPIKQLEAQKCFGAILVSVGSYVRNCATSVDGHGAESSSEDSRPSLLQLQAMFAEDLLPWVCCRNRMRSHAGQIVNVNPHNAPRKARSVDDAKSKSLKASKNSKESKTSEKPQINTKAVQEKLSSLSFIQNSQRPTYDVRSHSGHVFRGVPASNVQRTDGSGSIEKGTKVIARFDMLEQTHLELMI
jgi:hypothetical protein